ncbi:MAG: hypothetical protein U5K28_01440 [Halobacteriales archaeon]|nr:hypothetical protein [Halobacteriales archaeon]
MTDVTAGIDRERAVATIERMLDQASDSLPVPLREIWVAGDIVVGLDPVPRVEIYLTKDLLFKDSPEREAEFEERYDISGVGKSVRAEWAEANPELLRADESGYVDPAACLVAHLLSDTEDEPFRVTVSNTSFERAVPKRLAKFDDGNDTRPLDPRAALLWADEGDGGTVSESALEKLRDNEFVFATLEQALAMVDEDVGTGAAADAIRDLDIDERVVESDVV